MTAGFIDYDLKGFRDVQGRFARRSDLLVSARRQAMRNVGRRAADALKARAPKRSGKFARGLVYRTYDRGDYGWVRVYSTGEHRHLLKWIVGGTRPHPIPKGGSAEQLAKGYPLRFYWEKGPNGPGIYHFWSVRHPGTKPNPFVEETMAAIGHEILAELRAVSASVVRAK